MFSCQRETKVKRKKTDKMEAGQCTLALMHCLVPDTLHQRLKLMAEATAGLKQPTLMDEDIR